MENDKPRDVGILAYGSLIGDPGKELLQAIVERIRCVTPFPVEFARSSQSRKGAPTLVPFDNGARVAAEILVLNISADTATDRLYRRELHAVGTEKVYRVPAVTSSNTVTVEKLENFHGVRTVLFTKIGANIAAPNPGNLAALAIASAKELSDGRDGISYLLAAMAAGIETPLSPKYRDEILRLTDTEDLPSALKKIHGTKS
ncbi:hypothetical protein HF206_30865 [Rhizobium leguminosarum]|uniref:hypothetical protein n=1 Tax=Rhizobium leguminosarum TaxID=384 RepID=UPI001C92A260|nr:hypothetical protein [Rhizobium leguminosarum]MBY2918467.1 hypothetical protein [Rhizobium leguminosarum]